VGSPKMTIFKSIKLLFVICGFPEKIIKNINFKFRDYSYYLNSEKILKENLIFNFFLLCSAMVKDTENTALNLKLCKKFELGFHGGNSCASFSITSSLLKVCVKR